MYIHLNVIHGVGEEKERWPLPQTLTRWDIGLVALILSKL